MRRERAVGLVCALLLLVAAGCATCSAARLIVTSVERDERQVVLSIKNLGPEGVHGEMVARVGLSYNDAWIPEWATVFARESYGVITLGRGEETSLVLTVPAIPHNVIHTLAHRLDTVWTGYTDTNPANYVIGLDVSIGIKNHAFAFLPQGYGALLTAEFGDLLDLPELYTCSPPTVGDYACDFRLLNLDGESVQLSQYKEHVIILCFWTGMNQSALDQLMDLFAIQMCYEKADSYVIAVCAEASCGDAKELVQDAGEAIWDFDKRRILCEAAEPGSSKDGRWVANELYGVSEIPTVVVIWQERVTYVGEADWSTVVDHIEGLMTE